MKGKYQQCSNRPTFAVSKKKKKKSKKKNVGNLTLKLRIPIHLMGKSTFKP